MAAVDPRLKIIALALKPALSLAYRVALPLDELYALVESTYLDEHLAHDLSHEQIARRMKRTARSIRTLSKALKERQHILDASPHLLAERLVLELLNRETCSRATLFARLPQLEEEMVHAAIESLLAQDFLFEDGDALRIREQVVVLLGEDLDAKLDGARAFVDWTYELFAQRFGFSRAAPATVLRMLNFRVSSERTKAMWDAAFQKLMEVADEFAEHDVAKEAETVSLGLGLVGQVSIDGTKQK